MATGIIAVMSGTAVVTYTPQTNAKIVICAGSTGNVNINTVSFSTTAGMRLDFYAAAGVPVQINSQTGSNIVVSAIEE